MASTYSPSQAHPQKIGESSGTRPTSESRVRQGKRPDGKSEMWSQRGRPPRRPCRMETAPITASWTMTLAASIILLTVAPSLHRAGHTTTSGWELAFPRAPPSNALRTASAGPTATMPQPRTYVSASCSSSTSSPTNRTCSACNWRICSNAAACHSGLIACHASHISQSRRDISSNGWVPVARSR